MHSWEKLKLDYEQTRAYLHALEEDRFRLLALVPVVTGIAFAAIRGQDPPDLTLALGIFGFLVTLGIVFYEIRNTQMYDEMQLRAKSLEALMALPSAGNRRFKRGGPLLNRPERTIKLFGLWLIWHDRGLALVYSTTLAAWSYLIVFAATAHMDIKSCAFCVSTVVWLIPVAVWFAFMWDFKRHDRATDVPTALPQEVQELLDKAPD